MNTDKTLPHIKLDEKMEVSDGGMLELKTPLSRGPRLFFSLCGSPRTNSVI